METLDLWSCLINKQIFPDTSYSLLLSGFFAPTSEEPYISECLSVSLCLSLSLLELEAGAQLDNQDKNYLKED